jgi:hypothetical protein
MDKKIQVNTTSINTRLNDPVAGDQQAKYLKRGLTYISNDDAVIPRDAGGNIIFNEGANSNPLLIIDPVAEQIQLNSALKILKTSFQYYKFPVSVTATQNPDLNVDFDLNQDPVYARYKPSENRFINATGIPSGILLDEIVEGNPQTSVNTYYITKDIKNSGVDIRIRAKISHYFLASSGFGTCYFTLMQSGPNKPINRYFRPGPNSSYASIPVSNPYNNDIANRASQFLNAVNSYVDSAKTRINLLPGGPPKAALTNHFNLIKSKIPNDIQSVAIPGYRLNQTLVALFILPITSQAVVFADLQDDYNNTTSILSLYGDLIIQAAQVDGPVPGSINPGETQILYIDEIIPNSQFDAGDSFGIGAFAGQEEQHTIFSEQTYMVVTNASKNVDEWNQPVG